MNQYLIPLNDDMYETIDDFILEQCTYYGDENNCKFKNLGWLWLRCTTMSRKRPVTLNLEACLNSAFCIVTKLHYYSIQIFTLSAKKIAITCGSLI